MVAALAMLVLPPTAAAQTPLEQLEYGDTVRFRHVVETLSSRAGSVRTDTTLRRIEGQVLEVTPDSLLLWHEGERTAAAHSAIQQLQVRRGTAGSQAGRRALRGALIGGAIGAVVMLGAASGASDSPGYGSTGNWVAGGAGAGLLIGAAAGALSGLATPAPVWVDVVRTSFGAE